MRPTTRLDLDLTGELVLGYALQAVTCIVIGLLLAHFARRRGLSHLRWWAGSWGILLVYVAIAALSLSSYFRMHLPATDWRRVLLSTLTLMAGLLQPAWMAIGTWEGMRDRPVPRRLPWLLIGGSVLLAVGIVLATATHPSKTLIRLGTRYLLTTGVFLGAAVLLWRQRRALGSTGPALLAVCCAAYGLGALHTFGWSLLLDLTPPAARATSSLTIPFYLGFLDVPLQMLLGLGMVMWALEAERVRAERALHELARSEAQLRQSQKMEVIGRLAGGVAHDFNNLLTILFGAAEELRETQPPGSSDHGPVADLQGALDRARGLTSQLLAFSRQQVARVEVVELSRYLAEQRSLVGRLLGPDVTLTLSLSPAPVTVRADPAQLSQVLLNLVVNARDAMPTGGQLTIRLQAVDEVPAVDGSGEPMTPGRHALLAVTDTGGGMTDAVRLHAFDPFFTTKGVGEGTGLGLSTVFGIVRAAGGGVVLESAVGRGTSVQVYWPVTTEAPVSGSAAVTPAIMSDHRRLRILVADDEPPVRALLVRLLTRRGHAVVPAADGAEALMRLETEGPFDLLVTDVVMPGLGGGELVAMVRATAPATKLLLVSGYSGDLGRAQIPDVVPWLQKPFTAAALDAAVAEAMGGAPTAR